MADSKISALGELAETPASGDLLVLVDVSDTTMAGTGTDKKIQYSNLVPAGGSNPTMYICPPMATSGAWAIYTGGGGTNTHNNAGVTLNTSATQNSYCKVQYNYDSGTYIFKGNRTFSCFSRFSTSGSDFEAFLGYGGGTISGTSITFTIRGFGFKQLRSGGGSVAGYATNADGTTETATSINSLHYTQLSAVKSGTTSIKYYQEGTLVATQTTNIPTDNYDVTPIITLAVCNKNVASETNIIVITANATVETNFPY